MKEHPIIQLISCEGTCVERLLFSVSRVRGGKSGCSLIFDGAAYDVTQNTFSLTLSFNELLEKLHIAEHRHEDLDLREFCKVGGNEDKKSRILGAWSKTPNARGL